MDISFRSCMTAGVATITATAVAFGPAVQEPRHPAPPAPVVQVASPPVKLAAQVQPLALTDVPNLLVGWLERFIVPPSASQSFPAPPSGPSAAPQSVTGTLEWAYHAIEPWVRYGFEVATYAVGWVPYVGWLSGQIMIFYNFGESIVHAIVHNTLDWLGGNGSFLFNLGEGITWSVNALIQLGIDEWNFWLPPLPPLPPLPFAATAAATTTEDLTTLAAADTKQVNEKRGALKDEAVSDVAGEEATVNETKEPKAPKEPKEPKAATEVAAQTEDSTESKDDSSPSTKAPANGKKPADKGPKAGTDSSSSPKGNDTKGGKKDDAGKKDDSGKKGSE